MEDLGLVDRKEEKEVKTELSLGSGKVKIENEERRRGISSIYLCNIYRKEEIWWNLSHPINIYLCKISQNIIVVLTFE